MSNTLMIVEEITSLNYRTNVNLFSSCTEQVQGIIISLQQSGQLIAYVEINEERQLQGSFKFIASWHITSE